ncbi:class E sortase [Streptomyces sp. RerS4]|uniref:class E sortase n=1 Tax=Streptomyces sp. RerS4 TaxID=2942449 RepID=UPI00201C2E6C|nr:class E sortase [Streptomyces sp. RerS4]UQX01980.1 class E sortase [Streptomyces sp. RerS4]
MSRARRRKAPPPADRSLIAGFLSLLGELLITVGLVLGLFVAYSLWWTNVLADRQASARGDEVRQRWQSPSPAASTPAQPGALDTKDGIGFLHVPAMKNGEVLVKESTAPDVLDDGVAGYYTEPVKSALPWDAKGNFALAAHRDGHGAKFHNIDKVKNGDAIVFETRDTWYVYKVFAELKQTSKYNVDVINPVPKESGKTAPGRYITLTTCTPVYTSKFRYVVWGELVRTEKVDDKRTLPAELR